MNDNTVFDKISAIHDQTMSKLRALNLPPYPSQYKKYFDDIFVEQADKKLKSSRKEHDVHKKDHCTSCRYLDIAQSSVATFTEAHSDISHVAKMQDDYVNQLSQHDGERCTELVSGLARLGGNMSDELKKAQSKIDKLTIELKQAVSESITDPLTQITNRKGLIEDLGALIDAGQAKQLSVVLMMIDADNFKLLNDEYGHLAGDKVLYFLAHSIKSIIRSGDGVYRYGGEEFTVILNRCDQEQAVMIADKIRSKIEHSHLIYMGKTIHVTVSIGVTFHQQGDSYDDLVSRADNALYRAKKARKNCTVFFD